VFMHVVYYTFISLKLLSAKIKKKLLRDIY